EAASCSGVAGTKSPTVDGSKISRPELLGAPSLGALLLGSPVESFVLGERAASTLRCRTPASLRYGASAARPDAEADLSDTDPSPDACSGSAANEWLPG